MIFFQFFEESVQNEPVASCSNVSAIKHTGSVYSVAYKKKKIKDLFTFESYMSRSVRLVFNYLELFETLKNKSLRRRSTTSCSDVTVVIVLNRFIFCSKSVIH